MKVRTNLVLVYFFFSPEPKAELMAKMSPRISFTVSAVSFLLTFSPKFGSQDALKVLLQCEEAGLDLPLISGQTSSELEMLVVEMLVVATLPPFCTSQRINQGPAGLRALQTAGKEGKALLFTDLFLLLIAEGNAWRYRNVFRLFSYVLHILLSYSCLVLPWFAGEKFRRRHPNWLGKFHTLHIFWRYSDKMEYSSQFSAKPDFPFTHPFLFIFFLATLIPQLVLFSPSHTPFNKQGYSELIPA